MSDQAWFTGRAPGGVYPGDRLYRVLAAVGFLNGRRVVTRILPVFLTIFLCACAEDTPERLRHEISGQALGTSYRVSIVTSAGHFDPGDIRFGAEAAINDVDMAMSTWKADSELTRFNESDSTGWTEIGDLLFEVLVQARSISSQTGGAFDITVGRLVELWGFGKNGPGSALPGGADIARAKESVGFAGLELNSDPRSVRKKNPAMRLDLSAIAKGYAVDRVAAYLEEAGVTNFLVEIGGELKASGVTEQDSPWHVAVEIPRPSGGVQAVVSLQDMSIATSGDYRNYFVIDGQRFSHTLNPATGWPVAHELASVSVLAPDTMMADALATALMVMGPVAGYAYAVENELAVYMLIRDGDEMTEKITMKFSQYLEIID